MSEVIDVPGGPVYAYHLDDDVRDAVWVVKSVDRDVAPNLFGEIIPLARIKLDEDCTTIGMDTTYPPVCALPVGTRFRFVRGDA